MKKVLFLLINCLLFFACNNDDDASVNPIDQLPPATQTGAGTFGCLVNGKAFVDNSGFFNCFYQYVDGEYYFHISGEDEVSGITEIEFQANEVNLEQGGTYLLENLGNFSTSAIVFFSDTFLHSTTIANNPGTLSLIKLDFENNIVSGVFEFDVVHPTTGDTIKVRHGRFDTMFTQ